MIRRSFKYFILFCLCLFGFSCTLQNRYGEIALALPENGLSSGRTAARGVGELPLGDTYPDIYTIKVTPNSGDRILVEGNAGQNIVIANLMPDEYEVIVEGTKNNLFFHGKTNVTVKAGKTVEARLVLYSNEIETEGGGGEVTPEPELPEPEPEPNPEPETPTELTTYYVGGSGASDETGTGAQDKPFATVGKVITAIGARTEQITINVNGTVKEDISVDKSCNLIIAGNGVDSVLQGTGSSNVLYVSHKDANITLRNIKITGGKGIGGAGGAICNMHGTVNLEDGVNITGNSAINGAGAYLGYDDSTLTLKGSVKFDSGNDICIGNQGKIKILGNLTNNIFVNVIDGPNLEGCSILTGTPEIPELIKNNYLKFELSQALKDKGYILTSEGKLKSNISVAEAVSVINTEKSARKLKVNFTQAEEFRTLKTALLGNKEVNAAFDIEIVTSLTSIPENAFNGVTNLTRIVIPKSITNIGAGAFAGCTKLAKISLPASSYWLGYNVNKLDKTEIYTANTNETSNATAFVTTYSQKTITKTSTKPVVTPNTYYVKATAIGDGSCEINPAGSVEEIVSKLPDKKETYTINVDGIVPITEISCNKSYNLVIQGKSGSGATLNGANSNRVLNVNLKLASSTVTLSNIKVAVGTTKDGCGIYLTKGNLILDNNVEIAGRTAGTNGSSIYVASNDTTCKLTLGEYTKFGANDNIYLADKTSRINLKNGFSTSSNINIVLNPERYAITGQPILVEEVGTFSPIKNHGSKFKFDDGRYGVDTTETSTKGNLEEKILSSEVASALIESAKKDMTLKVQADYQTDFEKLRPSIQKSQFNISLNISTTSIIIPENAFSGCSKLVSVNIPSGIKYINKNAFNGSGLTSVTFEDQATNWTIKKSASESVVYSVSEITVDMLKTASWEWTKGGEKPVGVTWKDVQSKIENTTEGKLSFILRDINNENIINLAAAVKKASSYTTVELDLSNCTGLTSIGLNCFDSCIALVNIIFPDSLASIEEKAFIFCEGLTQINTKNVKTLGSSAFKDCSGLVTAALTNVNTINDACFMNCKSLTDVTITGIWTLSKNGTTEPPYTPSSTSKVATDLTSTYLNHVWTKNTVAP